MGDHTSAPIFILPEINTKARKVALLHARAKTFEQRSSAQNASVAQLRAMSEPRQRNLAAGGGWARTVGRPKDDCPPRQKSRPVAYRNTAVLEPPSEQPDRNRKEPQSEYLPVPPN